MKKSYANAIRDVLDEALQADPFRILFGEDIGIYGGCFGVTKDLYSKYGSKRIVDMPMSEQGFFGLAVGAAMNGLKPVVEIMFMDFVTLIYDQLFNHASIFSSLTGGDVSVPLVLRVASGAGKGYGATHSKSLVSPLMHIPGVKIVAPSNANDAEKLLRASLEEDNPVIFVENKLLYSLEDEIFEESIEIGRGKIVREGKDVLLISFSKPVRDCLDVAADLEEQGVSAEVLDLRTVKPLDMDLIQREVERIGKVIIVEEGYSCCSVSSEIVSRIIETSFYSLESPIKRVCVSDEPFPCRPDLECEMVPSKNRILLAVKDILNGP